MCICRCRSRPPSRLSRRDPFLHHSRKVVARRCCLARRLTDGRSGGVERVDVPDQGESGRCRVGEVGEEAGYEHGYQEERLHGVDEQRGAQSPLPFHLTSSLTSFPPCRTTSTLANASSSLDFRTSNNARSPVFFSSVAAMYVVRTAPSRNSELTLSPSLTNRKRPTTRTTPSLPTASAPSRIPS